MLKKTIIFCLTISILLSCSTQKEASKTVINPPEGIEFTKVENYKGFAEIYLPYSGSGFRKNNDVDVDRSRNDAGELISGVRYEGYHLSYWAKLGKTEGGLDAQFEYLKKKWLRSLIRENSELVFEKKVIDKQEIGFFKVSTPKAAGYINITYGYLIPHNNKAAVFWVKDAMLSGPKHKPFEKNLELALNYMIRTVKFQN